MADVYEHDMRCVMALLDAVKALDIEDVNIEAGTRIPVGSRNDYLIGTLVYEEDQWRFEPYQDAPRPDPSVRPSGSTEGDQ